MYKHGEVFINLNRKKHIQKNKSIESDELRREKKERATRRRESTPPLQRVDPTIKAWAGFRSYWTLGGRGKKEYPLSRDNR